MKYLLSFGLLLFNLLPVYSQNQNLMVVRMGEKWGVINAKRETVIEPQFDFIGKFDHNGQAIAQKDLLYGIIDNKGNTIVEFKYTYLKALAKTGTWVFRENELFGIINSKDNIILKNEYESIHEISKSASTLTVFLVQKKGKYAIANSQGKLLCDFIKGEFHIINNTFIASQVHKKQGLIHKDKGELLKPTFQNIEILSEKFISFIERDKKGVYSLETNTIIINAGKYTNFKMFQQNNLPQDYLYVYQNEKVGIINEKGKVILQPADYEQIRYSASGDVFLVRKGRKFGISSNRTGKLINPKYELISEFKQNIAQVILDEKKGIINNSGEEIAKPIYKKVEVKGNSARLHLDNGSIEILILDNDGRVLDRSKLTGKIRHLKIKQAEAFDFSWTEKEQKEAIRANQRNQRENPKYIWRRNNKNRWGLRRFANQSQVVLAHIYNNIITGNNANVTIAQKAGQNFLVDDVRGELFVEDGVSWNLNEVVQDFSTGSYVARWKYAEEDSVYNSYIFRGESLYDEGKNQSYPFKYYKGSGSMEIIKVEPFVNGYSKFLAQNNSYKSNPKPTHWGVMNDKGSMILNAVYDEIEIVEDDSSTYFITTQERRDSRYGFVDEIGKVKVDLKYSYVKPFSEGKAAVGKSKREWGMIDSTGKMILASKFQEVGNCKQNKIYTKYSRFSQAFYFRPDSSIAFEKKVYKSEDFDKNNFAIVQKNGKYGIIDTSGKWVLKIKHRNIDKFNEFGLAKVRKDEKYYFLVDTTGKKTQKDLFIKIEDFNSQGLARVRFKNKLYNFVNRRGKLISKQGFKSTRYFNDDLVGVQMPKTNLWGFIDSTGRFVIRPKYKTITSFCNGYARVSFTKDTTRKRKNSRGKTVYEKVKKTDVYFIDIQENKLGNLPESVYWFRADRFIEIGKYQNELAKVRRYGRYGFIDKTGRFVISPYYQEASDFYQGYSFVRRRNEYFYINPQGNVVENVPKSIQDVLDTRPITERYQIVEVEGKKGLIDLNGRFIVPPKYDEIGKFSEGLVSVGLKSFKGIYDANGNLALATEYEEISLTDIQTFRIEGSGKVGYWHATKGWIWDLK